MRNHHYQIVGMIGFIIAGIIYAIVGINSADNLVIAGSVVWTVSCFVMLVPLVWPKE